MNDIMNDMNDIMNDQQAETPTREPNRELLARILRTDDRGHALIYIEDRNLFEADGWIVAGTVTSDQLTLLRVRLPALNETATYGLSLSRTERRCAKRTGIAMTRLKQTHPFPAAAEIPAENWCYVVEVRFVADKEPENHWRSYPWGVAHFRSEAGAKARLKELTDDNCRSIELGLLGFQAVPKYIGYIPAEDETWIKP